MTPKKDPETQARLNDMAMQQMHGKLFSFTDWLSASIPDVVKEMRSILTELTEDAASLNIPSLKDSVTDSIINMGVALIHLERFQRETLGAIADVTTQVGRMENTEMLKAINARASHVLGEMKTHMYRLLDEIHTQQDIFKEEVYAVERQRRKLARQYSIEQAPAEDASLNQSPTPIKNHATRIEELQELMRQAQDEHERELISELISYFQGNHESKQHYATYLQSGVLEEKIEKKYLVRLDNYSKLAWERSEGHYL